MALESPHVKADVVEVNEFPFLIQRYSVRGVPKIIFNDKIQVEGAIPEADFIQQVMKAAENAAGR